jgi:hypothetical protein
MVNQIGKLHDVNDNLLSNSIYTYNIKYFS